MLIEQYAYSSKIKDIEPKLKLYFSMVFLGITLFTHQYITLVFVFCLMIGLSTMLGRIPIFVFLKLLLLPFAFLSIGVIGIMVSYSDNTKDLITYIPMFSGYMGVTKIGFNQGTFIFVKALVATGCMYFLILNTPMMDILSALKRLRLPSVFLVLMELMYRFIFIVMDAANGIYVAQKSRLGYSSYRKSYSSLGKLASVLFVRSFLRIDELFRSLEARGYDGEINVLDRTYIKLPLGYLITSVIAIGLILMESL